MSRITRMDARNEANRLALAGYRLPDGGTLDSLAQTWVEVLDNAETVDLNAAVTEYLKTGGRYWPKPSEIRELALQQRRARGSFSGYSASLAIRYRQWEQDPNGGCPVCGATLQLLSSEQMGGEPGGKKRYGVYHDKAKHYRARVQWVGPPYIRPDEDEPRDMKRIGPGHGEDTA